MWFFTAFCGLKKHVKTFTYIILTPSILLHFGISAWLWGVNECGTDWLDVQVKWMPDEKVHSCREHWPSPVASQFFTVSSLILQYLIPGSIITYCYVKVYCEHSFRSWFIDWLIDWSIDQWPDDEGSFTCTKFGADMLSSYAGYRFCPPNISRFS
jgi:hypothetical protein